MKKKIAVSDDESMEETEQPKEQEEPQEEKTNKIIKSETAEEKPTFDFFGTRKLNYDISDN